MSERPTDKEVLDVLGRALIVSSDTLTISGVLCRPDMIERSRKLAAAIRDLSSRLSQSTEAEPATASVANEDGRNGIGTRPETPVSHGSDGGRSPERNSPICDTATAQEAETGGWRPIETANRNISVRWLANAKSLCLGFWDEVNGSAGWFFHPNGYYDTKRYPLWFEPTRWQPCPQLPASPPDLEGER